MSLRFAGKHCAVVGATGSIGFAIARAFAREGAVITLLSRSVAAQRTKLEAQMVPYKAPTTPNHDAVKRQTEAAQFSKKGKKKAEPPSAPSEHRFFPLEVLSPEDIENTFSSDRVVGPLDILVNCVGISQTTLLKRTPDMELADILATNLLATMLICKHAKMQPNGCIINVSSLMAIKGGLGATAYAASKAGLVGFTRALCNEMAARPVRVNALLPGWVNSPMWAALKPELQQAYLKDTPLNRVAEPDEVAEAAVFLASNGFANNCILNLDGGLSAA